jgi:hypothetical protein
LINCTPLKMRPATHELAESNVKTDRQER